MESAFLCPMPGFTDAVVVSLRA